MISDYIGCFSRSPWPSSPTAPARNGSNQKNPPFTIFLCHFPREIRDYSRARCATGPPRAQHRPFIRRSYAHRKYRSPQTNIHPSAPPPLFEQIKPAAAPFQRTKMCHYIPQHTNAHHQIQFAQNEPTATAQCSRMFHYVPQRANARHQTRFAQNEPIPTRSCSRISHNAPQRTNAHHQTRFVQNEPTAPISLLFRAFVPSRFIPLNAALPSADGPPPAHSTAQSHHQPPPAIRP